MSRRARPAALLGLSAVCAGLAVSLMNGYANDVRSSVGPLEAVVVARRPLDRGTTLRRARVMAALGTRSVPARFVPAGTLRAPGDAIGLRTLVAIPAGGYVGAAELGSAGGSRSRVIHGSSGPASRVVEISVTAVSSLAPILHPGARVDVLVTSERGPGSPRTYLALQRLELVGLRSAGAAPLGDAGSAHRDAVAALRVTLRQAVLLTAAQNFARELRIVPRAPGDERRFPRTVVSASDLHP
jgi:pilus assembly protein CpaB